MDYQDLPEEDRERLKDEWREQTTRQHRRRERIGDVGFNLFLVAVLAGCAAMFRYAQVYHGVDVPVLTWMAIALAAAAVGCLLRAVWAMLRK